MYSLYLATVCDLFATLSLEQNMKNLLFFAALATFSLFTYSTQAEDKKNLLKPVNNLESWRVENHEDAKGTAKVEDDAIVFTQKM